MAQSVPQVLHDATLALLDRTGVGVDWRPALELMAEHRVRVDFQSRRVYPTGEHVEQALALAPPAVTVYGRGTGAPYVIGGEDTYILAGGGSLRVLGLDGRFEAATWEHLRQFNILLDALPNIDLCINQVDPQDDDGEGFYRRIAAEMLIGMPKPCLLQAFSGADVRAMAEMGAVVRGSRPALEARPIFVVAANAEPPLHISGHVAELLMEACRAGLPAHLGNYNMIGITAPATVAGAVVQINAVQLVALILSQLVRPGAQMMYTVFSGGGNLRTLDPITADPMTVQQQRLAAQLGRFYGLPVYGVAATDAQLPDAQAACERAVQLAMAMESGMHLVQGPTSMMDAMMLSSFGQAVIDDDIVGYVRTARKMPELSAETLALDAMHDVVADPELRDLKFAGHPHTVRHMRDELWQPRTFCLDSHALWERAGAPSVVDRANAVARKILDGHRPEPLPDDMAKEIRRIAQLGAK
jgi:trimethylamine--corrinoid protein Co-methyltransferase